MLIKNVIKRSDMISCTLCKDAPCSSACKVIDPAGALLGIWFDNQDVAAMKLPDVNPGVTCEAL